MANIPQLHVDTITLAQLAKTIDHSLLQPQLTRDDIIAGCKIAAEYQVASVCVKQCYVPLAADLLAGTDVLVCTVCGFPHGSMTSTAKAWEAREIVSMGAVEVDMVQNVGELKSRNFDAVKADIAAVREACGPDVLLKVILENALLTTEEIALSSKLAEQAGADYVKTSTGYADGGAKIEDLKLMRASVGPSVGVKAAGGVRTMDSALAAVAAGATRLGATATAKILDEFRQVRGG